MLQRLLLAFCAAWVLCFVSFEYKYFCHALRFISQGVVFLVAAKGCVAIGGRVGCGNGGDGI